MQIQGLNSKQDNLREIKTNTSAHVQTQARAHERGAFDKLICRGTRSLKIIGWTRGMRNTLRRAVTSSRKACSARQARCGVGLAVRTTQANQIQFDSAESGRLRVV